MKVIKNYIDGQWVESKSTEMLEVVNPATTEVLAHVPLSPPREKLRKQYRRPARSFMNGDRPLR